MSISRHPKAQPDECARCRQVFAELLRAAADGLPITASEIGRRLGTPEKPLSERSVRLHLAYLVQHQRVKPDGRKPVAGAIVGGNALALDPTSTALDWTAAQEVNDASCRKMLDALGAVGWSGTVMKSRWAKDAKVGPATVTRHRPHLARLVEFKHNHDHDAAGRLVQRPDSFRLVETFRLTPVLRPVRAGGDLFDRKAVDLLERVEYLSSEDTQDAWLLSLVARALREGMPAPALLHRLTDGVPRKISNSAAFLASRVPASGAEVTIAAQLAIAARLTPKPETTTVPVQATAELARVECDGCGRDFRPIRVGVVLCRTCRSSARVGA